MLKHYLKIAFRNLWKYKTQSVISIIGLTVGFTCFALASLWMRHEKSYDNFYRDGERIYLIRSADKDLTDSYRLGMSRSHTPDPIVGYLKQHFPELETATRFDFRPEVKTTVSIKHNGQTFDLRELPVDTSFVNLFGLETLEGDLQFLQRGVPGNEIALTESKAKQMFGKEPVLGKTITFSSGAESTVVAVLKDRPGPSNFPFDALLVKNSPIEENWSISGGATFVKLYPNVSVEAFNEKIGSIKITQTVMTNMGERAVDRELSFEIVPIDRVRSDYPFTIPEVEQKHILLFVLSGTLLIFCSLFNFFTLFISRFRIRRKEFAIRLVNGSSLGSLFLLLACEFFVVLLLVVLLSIVFIKILFPSFCLLAQINISLFAIYGEALIYISGIILVSFLIFFLCLVVFRKRSLGTSIRRSGNHLFRKTSIVLQLIISIGFIFCTIVMQKQLRYLHTVDIGFNYKDIGEISMYPYPDFMEWQAQMLHVSGVKKALAGNPPLMPPSIMSTNRIYQEDGSFVQLESFRVSEGFFELLGIELLEGEFFTDSDPLNTVVITESVVKALDLKDPIGEKMGSYTIKGLVKDIHNSLPTLPPKPIFFQPINPEGYRPNIVIFSYEEGNWDVVQKHIREWREKNYGNEGGYTLKCSEDVYNDYFRSEEALLKLIGIVSLVCIFISVFGFVSMVSLTCEERRKEMAIRKVNGATLGDIISIFFKEYFLLLLISAVIIFPVSYYIMKQWIEDYTLQTTIPAWIYVLIILALLLIIIACVGWKVLETARRNPAKTLKSE